MFTPSSSVSVVNFERVVTLGNPCIGNRYIQKEILTQINRNKKRAVSPPLSYLNRTILELKPKGNKEKKSL